MDLGIELRSMTNTAFSQELQLAVHEALVGNATVGAVACVDRDVITYLTYLKAQITPEFTSNFSPLFIRDFRKECQSSEKVVWALVKVAALLRANLSAAIDDIVKGLIDDAVLDLTCATDNTAAAQYMIFCIQGWLTLLYLPSPPDGPQCQHFKVNTQGSGTFRLKEQPLSQSSRPFLEVLEVFGVFSDLVRPTSNVDGYADSPKGSTQILLPSFLNASIITTIGGLEICWVDTLSAHLTFDSSKKLFVFRLPSFARLQAHEGSLLENVLGSLNDDDEGRIEFPFLQVADEIIRSYELLFGADRKAQSLYRSKERQKAEKDTRCPDRLLDELCGYHVNRFKLGSLARPLTTIDASVHFPVLASRLLRLQRFVETRQARGLRALYYDQRNSYQWWTFWAVIWIGGISLFLSFVQTTLTAVQTVYSIKSFNVKQP
ncbi:Fc.00g112930.m01.CDS01 [Cosmosporella sp. VM-42]